MRYPRTIKIRNTFRFHIGYFLLGILIATLLLPLWFPIALIFDLAKPTPRRRR
ncbi:hypothetical protein SAMN06296952_2446 [Oscillospiraceae bacterium]|nr:hypothetical protein SAMN06296952_2446 [Oscillospiraceae bacterium]